MSQRAIDTGSMTTIRTDWHRVGVGLSVRFEHRSGRLAAEWMPRPPTKSEWKRVVERYRSARHAVLAAMAEQIGGTVLCVEVQE